MANNSENLGKMPGLSLGCLSPALTPRSPPKGKNFQQSSRAYQPLKIWGKGGHFSIEFIVQEAIEGVTSWTLEKHLRCYIEDPGLDVARAANRKHQKISSWIKPVP